MSIFEDKLHAQNEAFEAYMNDLIDRDTPIKPIISEYDKTLRCCANCKSLLFWDNNFCANCGQRVDWSEEE